MTKFTLRTYPIGEVWGGFRFYLHSDMEKLYGHMHDFGRDISQDPKSAIIFTDLIWSDGSRNIMVFYFYDGPEPPTTGPFADFLALESLFSTTMKQSYATLVCQVLFPGVNRI